MSTTPKQQFIFEHLELYIIFKIPSNKALTAEINKYVVVTKHCIMSQLKVGITKGSVTEVLFPGLPPSHKLITVVIVPLGLLPYK